MALRHAWHWDYSQNASKTSTGIDCSPRDEWVTILNYENTVSTEVTLAYKKSVGTAFAGNPTEAEAEEFFAKFSDTIGRMQCIKHQAICQ